MKTTNYGSVSKENLKTIISEVIESRYTGSVFVKFEDEECRNFAEKIINTYNIVEKGCIFMKENVPYIEIVEGNNSHDIIPDYFRIAFTCEFSKIYIGKDAFIIDEIAEKCSIEKQDITIEIHKSLNKEAIRVAKMYGVQFSNGVFSIYKNSSLMGRLESALGNGEFRMDIPLESTSIHTVRAYCGILRQTHSKPVTCRINGSNVTVYFRSATESESLREEIKDRIIKGADILTREDMISILDLFDIHFADMFQEYMGFMYNGPNEDEKPDERESYIDNDEADESELDNDDF